MGASRPAEMPLPSWPDAPIQLPAGVTGGQEGVWGAPHGPREACGPSCPCDTMCGAGRQRKACSYGSTRWPWHSQVPRKRAVGSKGLTQLDRKPCFRFAQNLTRTHRPSLSGTVCRPLQTLFPELLGRQALQGTPVGKQVQAAAERGGLGRQHFQAPS